MRPILVVEWDEALPDSFYEALESLQFEVLGPTNDAIDVLCLARDRKPQLVILDYRIEAVCRLDLEVILSTLGIPCLTISLAEYGNKAALSSALQSMH